MQPSCIQVSSNHLKDPAAHIVRLHLGGQPVPIVLIPDDPRHDRRTVRRGVLRQTVAGPILTGSRIRLFRHPLNSERCAFLRHPCDLSKMLDEPAHPMRRSEQCARTLTGKNGHTRLLV